MKKASISEGEIQAFDRLARSLAKPLGPVQGEYLARAVARYVDAILDDRGIDRGK